MPYSFNPFTSNLDYYKSQEYEEYVLNPSGTQAGRVFTSLTDCIAAINAAGNPKSRITLIDNVSTTIPSNSNMDNIILAGSGTSVLQGGLSLTITSGSVSSWAGFRIEAGLGFIWAASNVMYTVSGFFTMIVDAGSALYRTGSAHMFSSTNAIFIVALQSGSVILGSSFGGGPIVDVGSAGEWILAMSGSGTNVDTDIITGTSGSSFNPVFSDSAPELDVYTISQSAFSGTPSYSIYPKMSHTVALTTYHTASTLSILPHHTVLFDASSNAITATLPDISLVSNSSQGREFVLIGYDATNTITINTTSSQQIRRKTGDTATSITLAAGDILKLRAVNLGGGTAWWQITS